MESFKLVAWNIEHSDRLLTALGSPSDTTKRRAEERCKAIREEIAALKADVLLISEGPRGEERARAFFDRVAPEYALVVRDGEPAAAYGIVGGSQWLWFLVRKAAPVEARLMHLDRWRTATERASRGDHKSGRWDVSYPLINKASGVLEFSVPERHSHYRHPQLLQVVSDGCYFEIIGSHLKSKFTGVRPQGDPMAADFFANNHALVADIIKSRTKLTTECADIRHYVEARFDEDEDAAVILAGDLNDGPGKERIERRFLYHDLVGALQGEIFFARRFFNHALFDTPEGERWSVHFNDRLDPARSPLILLDHILFSQSMTSSHTGRRFGYVARRAGGRVEHEVHHRIASARHKYAATSDHRPVSMIFDRNRGS